LQSDRVCQDYSKSKVGRFLSHSVVCARVGCGLLLQTKWRGLLVGLSVCVSICWSVSHDRESRKSSWTDRDAVWDPDLGKPKEHGLDGFRCPHVKGQFWGRKGAGPGHADMSGSRYTQSDSTEGSTGTVRM